MKKIMKLTDNVYAAEQILTAKKGVLAAECQKYVDFGEVHVDILPGDGVGIAVDGGDRDDGCSDMYHVTPEVFCKLIKNGRIDEADFIKSTTI